MQLKEALVSILDDFKLRKIASHEHDLEISTKIKKKKTKFSEF